MRMTLQTHYYQPIWTLVGGGLKDQAQSGKPMASVLPKKATWIKDTVATFDPDNNRVTTASGEEIAYEFLVVAMGLQLRYESVKVRNEYGCFELKACKDDREKSWYNLTSKVPINF